MHNAVLVFLCPGIRILLFDELVDGLVQLFYRRDVIMLDGVHNACGQVFFENDPADRIDR